MSFFVYVHKNSATAYEEKSARIKAYRAERDLFISQNKKGIVTPHGYRNEDAILHDQFDADNAERYAGLYTKIPGILHDSPEDPENYYVYYRGFRFGEGTDSETRTAFEIQGSGLGRCLTSVREKIRGLLGGSK